MCVCARARAHAPFLTFILTQHREMIGERDERIIRSEKNKTKQKEEIKESESFYSTRACSEFTSEEKKKRAEGEGGELEGEEREGGRNRGGGTGGSYTACVNCTSGNRTCLHSFTLSTPSLVASHTNSSNMCGLLACIN